MSEQERLHDIDPQETQEWLDALADVLDSDGAERAGFLLSQLQAQAGALGIGSSYVGFNTPYTNTIALGSEPNYPGNLAVEAKIEGYIRYNAAAMVAGANKRDGSLGGHISSFASSCTMYEVGFNHFWHAASADHGGDLIFFQGHTSPGMYARSFIEGRLTDEQVFNFRKESTGKGISSYPHPWLMPTYWQFPTVSMGLGPITAIYQARFMKYLQARGLAKTDNRHVWAFCGDGEMDEPESTGALTRAGREKLDNLVFVVNCNLQRLDGLVNGNGKIIQELESTFAGAGWHVIKIVWGGNWKPLFEKDSSGVLLKYLSKACDGDFQTYAARGGAYMREHFFGQDPALAALVQDLTDDQIAGLSRGGHDPKAVYAAFQQAVEHTGQPVVILAKTVKGFGLGDAGESRNTAHNTKKLKASELQYVRDRFNVPVSDEDVESFKPVMPKEKEVLDYLHAQRKNLGGYLPERQVTDAQFEIPHYHDFAKRLLDGTPEGREMSTTTAYVQILTALCKDASIGKYCVPITPDESRTFGMEGLFRQLGIYNPFGQRYEPEDRQQVMYYKESIDGQILQEGINEGGAFSSWVAAATAYSVHHVPMIPFYIYYSMFGHQRIGDLAWLAGDMRARGFLLGATAGRTTLNGEGLQHEDGHSHIMANLVPNAISYDPTYAYELAVIMWHGLNRMYKDNEDVYFYITMMNENYIHRAMPEGAEAGIIKGVYRLVAADKPTKDKHVQLMGSGTILKEVEAAAEMLEKDFGITSDIWSVTSANELTRDGLAASRWNRLHPTAKEQKKAYITEQLEQTTGPVIAATDYVRLYSEQLRDYIPRRFVTLGTDGFGRSDSREALRAHFEVDRYHVAFSAVKALYDEGLIDAKTVEKALKQYNIDSEKQAPIEA